MSKLSYGEAHTRVKESLHMANGKFQTIKLPKHRGQMSKADAGKYYTNKLRLYWDEILKLKIADDKERAKLLELAITNNILYRRCCFRVNHA